jgi:hypothetical protein
LFGWVIVSRQLHFHIYYLFVGVDWCNTMTMQWLSNFRDGHYMADQIIISSSSIRRKSRSDICPGCIGSHWQPPTRKGRWIRRDFFVSIWTWTPAIATLVDWRWWWWWNKLKEPYIKFFICASGYKITLILQPFSLLVIFNFYTFWLFHAGYVIRDDVWT